MMWWSRGKGLVIVVLHYAEGMTIQLNPYRPKTDLVDWSCQKQTDLSCSKSVFWRLPPRQAEGRCRLFDKPISPLCSPCKLVTVVEWREWWRCGLPLTQSSLVRSGYITVCIYLIISLLWHLLFAGLNLEGRINILCDRTWYWFLCTCCWLSPNPTQDSCIISLCV